MLKTILSSELLDPCVLVSSLKIVGRCNLDEREKRGCERMKIQRRKEEEEMMVMRRDDDDDAVKRGGKL